MITAMTKYDFILLGEQNEQFLTELQELGVVDITRSTKPVDDTSSQMLDKTLRIKKAISILESLDIDKDPDFEAVKAAAAQIQISGCKMENTLGAVDRLKSLKAELSAAESTLKACKAWGTFDRNAIDGLASQGIQLHFHCVDRKAYDIAWEDQFAMQIISVEDSKVWFVTACPADENMEFPFGEVAAPSTDESTAAANIQRIKEDIIHAKATLLELRENHLPHMRKGLDKHTAELDKYLAGAVAVQAVDGYICTYEGFAPSSEDERLAAAFDAMGILYVSEAAKEEDNPPIKLRNGKFASLFECLTGMYGMPVYGEWDPTPVLAVFFLMFFAICMGDAGYGLILIIYGILQSRKIVNISMFSSIGKLITVLGCATTVIGFFLGTAFGCDLTTVSWIPQGLRDCMLTGDIVIGGSSYALQMVLALCIGVFHLCLAMTIKAVLYTQRFGFKENISTWGWLLLILGGIITGIAAMVFELPSDITKYILIGIGAVSALGIFIFNKPGRNPLLNIGAGLWDTYNMATGILGDVLSYIRLYALGLAGGMLGGAFNNLGGMVLGDDPTWQWVPFVLILLAGHVLNLLMSCLGAFVHPLRLSFVEYFKNSGYEGKGREYNALKK